MARGQIHTNINGTLGDIVRARRWVERVTADPDTGVVSVQLARGYVYRDTGRAMAHFAGGTSMALPGTAAAAVIRADILFAEARVRFHAGSFALDVRRSTSLTFDTVDVFGTYAMAQAVARDEYFCGVPDESN